jgi:DNA-binding IscR family transcriptional regulator
LNVSSFGKLIEILKITDTKDPFEMCILQWKQCNSKKPCPMHHLITSSKNELIRVMNTFSIQDLMNDKSELRKQLLQIEM